LSESRIENGHVNYPSVVEVPSETARDPHGVLALQAGDGESEVFALTLTEAHALSCALRTAVGAVGEGLLRSCATFSGVSACLSNAAKSAASVAPLERLREKLAKCEREQVRMKAANAAIRKHAKAGAEAQVFALVALGFSEGNARDLLKPDFAGRIGFADFETRNNGAEIRRLEARIAQVERAKATPSVETEGSNGCRLEDAPGENRIRVFFPGKPDLATRDRLKAAGFRWTPTLGCWQAYRSSNTIAIATAIAGVERVP
jgi:hypothetical protein